MKTLGIILFLSTACTARQACCGAGDVSLALAPVVITWTLPHMATTQATPPKVFQYADAGIQFELPVGWKAEPAGETLTITAPDSSVSVVLWVPVNTGSDDAVKVLRSGLDKTIKNRKVTKPATQDTLNEMPVISESGTGEVEGTTVEWTTELITAKKPVICYFFAAPGIADKHAAEIAKFRRSIKKLN